MTAGFSIKPDPSGRRRVEQGSHAESFMCWTCGACDAQCPVNIRTNRLRPQKLVRMAYLGLLDELACNPEIWYCLGCRRCSSVCTNRVKPDQVAAYARREAVRQGVFRRSVREDCRAACTQLQYARAEAAFKFMHGLPSDFTCRLPPFQARDKNRSAHGSPATAFLCFNCSECGSACPIFVSRRVFDPQLIIRLVQFDMISELLKSPMIWLCIGCGSCTSACPQKVDACGIIRWLQKTAVAQGAVDPDFTSRFEAAEKGIYQRFVANVDAVLGFQSD
ncbi:MAG: 4Fe-4S dicluster domain-containing protein [Desulfobacteraceae bacterium]|nr:4Fe-4S dicluster domain-containing protein [Desulfobacteraceae bacterium]